MERLTLDAPATYRIRVKGLLDSSWSDRLRGLEITTSSQDVGPIGRCRAMGVILIVLGGTIFALGFRTYHELSQELKEEEIESTSVWFLGLMTLMLLLAAAFALILIFV